MSDASHSAIYYHAAQVIETWERGGALQNWPSSGDMWNAAAIACVIGDPGKLTLGEMSEYLFALAEIADKWVYPDGHPLSAEVFACLNRDVDFLRGLMNRTYPEGAQRLNQWHAFRVTAQAERRRVFWFSVPPAMGRIEGHTFPQNPYFFCNYSGFQG